MVARVDLSMIAKQAWRHTNGDTWHSSRVWAIETPPFLNNRKIGKSWEIVSNSLFPLLNWSCPTMGLVMGGVVDFHGEWPLQPPWKSATTPMTRPPFLNNRKIGKSWEIVSKSLFLPTTRLLTWHAWWMSRVPIHVPPCSSMLTWPSCPTMHLCSPVVRLCRAHSLIVPPACLGVFNACPNLSNYSL